MSLYQSLLSQGKIRFIVIDGLDGSGKGTLANILAQKASEEGDNVLIVDYPQYSSPWGKALKFLLKENDMGLSLEERMAVYALNRLESIQGVVETVETFKDSSAPLTIVFDRFPTSNLLTIAYYLANVEFLNTDLQSLENLLNEDLSGKESLQLGSISIQRAFEVIGKIDATFYDLFGVSNAPVIVPQINPRVSISRITADGTREGHDLYEKMNIQMIADYLYKKAEQIEGLNIVISPQEGRAPQEIADELFERYKKDKELVEQGEIVNFRISEEPEISEEINRAMESIFQDYPRLNGLLTEIENLRENKFR